MKYRKKRGNGKMKNKEVNDFEFDVKETKQRGGGANYNVEPLEEDEWYNSIFVRVERSQATFGEVLNWYFELEGEIYSYEYEGELRQRRIRGSSSLICTPKSKMYAWFKKLSGSEPEPGDRIDLTELYGTPCRVMVKNAEGKKDDEGNCTVYSNVVNIKGRKTTDEAKPVKKVKTKVASSTTKETKNVPEVKPKKATEESGGELFENLDDIF